MVLPIRFGGGGKPAPVRQRAADLIPGLLPHTVDRLAGLANFAVRLLLFRLLPALRLLGLGLALPGLRRLALGRREIPERLIGGLLELLGRDALLQLLFLRGGLPPGFHYRPGECPRRGCFHIR